MLTSNIEKPREHVSLVRLKGRLAYGNELQTLKTELAGMLAKRGAVVILDVSAIDYTDSSGIGALLYLDGVAKEAGASMRVAGVTRRVQEVLHMTHTDKILTLDPDVSTSLRLSGE
jgi:anti-sigma B factor antagonist